MQFEKFNAEIQALEGNKARLLIDFNLDDILDISPEEIQSCLIISHSALAVGVPPEDVQMALKLKKISPEHFKQLEQGTLAMVEARKIVARQESNKQ